MDQKILHVIASPFKWQMNSVKFRRHRLGQYIKGQKDTEKVLWVYPYATSHTNLSSYIRSIKQIQEGYIDLDDKVRLCGLPDLIPGRFQRFFYSLQRYHLKRLKEEIESYQGKKVLWFTFPGYHYLTQLTKWDKIIYDCSDLWRVPLREKDVFYLKPYRKLMKSTEEKILSDSNLVFTTSDYLADVIREHPGRNAIVVENGVDFELFRNDAFTMHEDLLKDIPRPRLGFIGGMKEKIDFPLLSKLAVSKPNWQIVLIGPAPSLTKEFKELLTHQNVHWLGGVAPNEVPKYMKCLDVGLLPYREIEYNKAVFPLKLYEYMASGLAIVGCGLPSTCKYQEDNIYLHTDANGFIEACEKVLDWGVARETIARRICLAEKANWNKKLETMYNAVFQGLTKV